MLAYFNNLKMLPLIKIHSLSALFKIGKIFIYKERIGRQISRDTTYASYNKNTFYM